MPVPIIGETGFEAKRGPSGIVRRQALLLPIHFRRKINSTDKYQDGPMKQVRIPAAFIRGGTSNAIVFHRKDLPEDRARWDRYWT